MNRLLKIICVTLCFTTFCLTCGCVDNKEEKKGVTVTDQIGNEIVISGEPKRIVSGYYVSTSALIALGQKDKIVGMEEGGDKRPIYSLATDRIWEKTANVGSAKAFDLEACLAANPDLVILPKKAKDSAEILNGMNIPTIVVNPETWEQLVDMIELLAKVTGSTERAQRIEDFYDKAFAKINDATEDLTSFPTVYMCNPNDPTRTCPKDMYQASLIRLAGGINAGDELLGDSWINMPSEQLLKVNPSVIIIPANSMATGVPEYAAGLNEDAVFKNTDAIKNGRVYQMPCGYESWDSPVPSGILGALWLTSTLNPDKYDKESFAQDVQEFYSEFYGFNVNKQDLI